MTDTRKITENAQNQTLDFVRQSQDAFVEAMQVWSDSLNRLVGTAQDRTASATELPKPEEVLDQVFDFAESLLSAQREFAHNVVRTASGVWAQAEAAGQETASQATEKAPGAPQATEKAPGAPQATEKAPAASQATEKAPGAPKKDASK